MEGSKGLFVSMPSYKVAAMENTKDICSCTAEARKAFDQAVIKIWTGTFSKQKPETPAEKSKKQLKQWPCKSKL